MSDTCIKNFQIFFCPSVSIWIPVVTINQEHKAIESSFWYKHVGIFKTKNEELNFGFTSFGLKMHRIGKNRIIIWGALERL